MLRALQIRDLAVIESVDLEFDAGFTVLTGETGAGKSILIDALALALGERGDTGAIRAGAERLDVTAAFSPAPQSAAQQWLAANDLDDGADCLLRRTVSADGRSKAWINGRPVTAAQLRELGSLLTDICGQQDYQSLRHRSAQRTVLDAQLADVELPARVRSAHHDWSIAAAAERELAAARDEGSRRQELLAFQVQELSALNPLAGEAVALEQENVRLRHRTRIADGLTDVIDRLHEGDPAAGDLIAQAARTLDELAGVDTSLTAPAALLREADIQLQEALALVRQSQAGLDHDPAREAAVADRLAALQEMARKHRVQVAELPLVRERLATELAAIENIDQSLAERAAATEAAHRRLKALAVNLTAARKAAARDLAAAVTSHMQELGMPNGRFEVRLAERSGGIGADGAEDVEFLVTANAGQPPGPLAKIASGGELSRLNLAIQVVASAAGDAPTLIFDEVDAGVGGAVAEIVGRKLRELSAARQVLCVTHLAQVAGQAGQQLRVAKTVSRSRTTTQVQPLDESARVEEIARMLGGVRITEATRALARDMLAAAATPVPKTASRRRKG